MCLWLCATLWYTIQHWTVQIWIVIFLLPSRQSAQIRRCLLGKGVVFGHYSGCVIVRNVSDIGHTCRPISSLILVNSFAIARLGVTAIHSFQFVSWRWLYFIATSSVFTTLPHYVAWLRSRRELLYYAPWPCHFWQAPTRWHFICISAGN